MACAAVVVLLSFKFLENPTLFFMKDITQEVYLVKFIQVFQALEIVLIIAGKSKGSLPASIAQVSGRMLVGLVFLETSSDQYCVTHMAICWAIADFVRCLYYLTKSEGAMILRYSLFIVLYPLGVYG
jgi:hypothetical protein